RPRSRLLFLLARCSLQVAASFCARPAVCPIHPRAAPEHLFGRSDRRHDRSRRTTATTMRDASQTQPAFVSIDSIDRQPASHQTSARKQRSPRLPRA
ncbi:hypothetical protein T310_7908, partial [Rasamsonia emersonii CBS 393.64]